eukprot:1378491-Amphidinium_carterae.1
MNTFAFQGLACLESCENPKWKFGGLLHQEWKWQVGSLWPSERDLTSGPAVPYCRAAVYMFKKYPTASGVSLTSSGKFSNMKSQKGFMEPTPP